MDEKVALVKPVARTGSCPSSANLNWGEFPFASNLEVPDCNGLEESSTLQRSRTPSPIYQLAIRRWLC